MRYEICLKIGYRRSQQHLNRCVYVTVKGSICHFLYTAPSLNILTSLGMISRPVKIFREGAVYRLDISFHWDEYLLKRIIFWVRTFNLENSLH